MHDMTFMQMVHISYVIPVLMVFSVVLLAFALERMVYYMANGSVNQRMLDEVRKLAHDGKLEEARKKCQRYSGLLPQAVSAQISGSELTVDQREDLIALYHMRMQTALSRRLSIFGTLSFISPLLGLLGTVLGVMRAFKDVAVSGSGKPTIVAAGISEALIATAFGIAVAVTAAMIHNYFHGRMKDLLTAFDIFGQELICLIPLHHRKAA